MSIIIKGTDIPDTCDECFAYHTDRANFKGCFITMNIDTRNKYQSRSSLCPLTEIPYPHGRLIDANNVFTYDYIDEQQLKEVPTIFEAEGMDSTLWFKDRMNIEKQYLKWCKENSIAEMPNSMVVFMESNHWLDMDKIKEDLKKGK